MGPRSIDRGSEISHSEYSIPKPLQWGRDQLIAEVLLTKIGKFPSLLLQWGRDQLIAEVSFFGFLQLRLGSFNGAAIN